METDREIKEEGGAEEEAQRAPETKKPPSAIELFFESRGVAWNTVVRTAATVAVVIGCGVIVIAVAGHRALSQRKAEQASMSFLRAKTSSEFGALVDRYPSSGIAPLAMLRQAHAQYSEGNYALAASVYGKFLEKFPDHPLKLIAEAGKIFCIEAQGQPDQIEKALEGYTAFARQYPDCFLAAEAVLGRARCIEQLGRLDEARQVYEDFIAANPNSAMLTRAERALSDLKIELRRRKGTL